MVNFLFGDIKAWKKEIKDHKYLILLSLLFLLLAVILNYFTGIYTNEAADLAVTDLILDYIPAINLGFLYIWGYTLVLLLLFIYPLFYNIKDLHVVISQVSLLIAVRSIFMTLTHLKTPIEMIVLSLPKFFNILAFQNDLFFSGHTALPFLGYLLFRKEKIRIFFLIATIVLGLTVLFMHAHYSIDVFAALFITYGTYKIGKYIFGRINH